MAVRLDLVDEILPKVLSSIVYGLMDDDDDVRAVAADTLHPMASAVVNNPIGFANLPQILTILWGISFLILLVSRKITVRDTDISCDTRIRFNPGQ